MEKVYTNIFKERLKEYRGLEGYIKESLHAWKEKYMRHREKPEERFEGRFVPGKIYSFNYKAQKSEDFSDEAVKMAVVLDHRPVLLSMGTVVVGQKVLEAGINMNAVPYQMRPVILDRVYTKFGNIIRDNENNLEADKKGSRAVPLTYDTAGKLLAGTGWSMAFMAFERSYIFMPAVVDYSDWGMVMGLNTMSMQGETPGSLYKRYVQGLAKNNKL